MLLDDQVIYGSSSDKGQWYPKENLESGKSSWRKRPLTILQG